MIEAFGRRFLLPGDIERGRERALVAFWGPALSATVALAAHHGSGTSSSLSWIKHVDPRLVIITAARANQFGHPHPRVLARFEERGIDVLNTAFDGAIALRVDTDGRLSCRRLRHRWQAFWRRGDGNRRCTPPAGR
jgi:competence protein ComEC